MSLSPDQLARRLEGIGASDVAAICGLNPHRSRVSVWLEKTGQVPPGPDTTRSKWGDILEPVIRRDYAERHGVRIEQPGTLAHPEHPWMLATPDGIVYQHGAAEPDRGHEIKTHTWRQAHLYGAPGSDEVPLWELCQCMWGIAVTGLERWDLTAFIDGQPTDYVIDRDDDAIAALTEQCERFLIDNVRGGAEPEPDGSPDFDRWLLQRWPRNPAAMIDLDAGAGDQEAYDLLARAKEVRAQAAELELEHNRIIQALKLKIGEAEGLTWKTPAGKSEKLTWKRSKPSRRTDVAGAFTDVKTNAALTVSASGPRVNRAVLSLKSAGDVTPIGHSSQATITAGELAEVVTEMHARLREIAAHQATVVEMPGARPFCFPRNWKAPSSAKEE